MFLENVDVVKIQDADMQKLTDACVDAGITDAAHFDGVSADNVGAIGKATGIILSARVSLVSPSLSYTMTSSGLVLVSLPCVCTTLVAYTCWLLLRACASVDILFCEACFSTMAVGTGAQRWRLLTDLS